MCVCVCVWCVCALTLLVGERDGLQSVKNWGIGLLVVTI